MEKTLIKYVLHMLTTHSTATLYDRLKTLLDILEAVPSYDHEAIICAACKIQEDEDNADV